jgi:hypothetical protein
MGPVPTARISCRSLVNLGTVDQPVTLTFARSEALVLFDLLADFRDGAYLAIRHPSQRVCLWAMQSNLEKQLHEPLLSEYERVLDEARNEVLLTLGSPENSGAGS